MFITMMGDMTAFVSLVFGYFFYWTIHADFPRASDHGVLSVWLWAGLAAILLGWGLTLFAREVNRRGHAKALRVALSGAMFCSAAGAAALLAGPWTAGMDPTLDVYPAIVWVIVIWVSVHAAVGVIMQVYCLAGSIAGRLSPEHDIDIWNVALFWSFVAVSAVIAVGVLGLFPLVV